VTFYVLKSYDGGKSWEVARRYADFASAAAAADRLRSEHPMMRFRLDVERPLRAHSRRQRTSSLARK
jgi:hypothetical protein